MIAELQAEQRKLNAVNMVDPLLDRAIAALTAQVEPELAWCGSLEKWWAQASDDDKKRVYGESIAAKGE